MILTTFFPKVTVDKVGNWRDAHLSMRSNVFDLALVDLNMSNRSSWTEELERIVKSNPKVPVCVVSGISNPESIKIAFEVGVKGYITKDHTPEAVEKAILTIMKGSSYIPDNIWFPTVRADSDVRISARQLDILVLIEKGYSNKKIADTIGTTEGTVKQHVHNIFSLLGAKNRIEATRVGRQKHILID